MTREKTLVLSYVVKLLASDATIANVKSLGRLPRMDISVSSTLSEYHQESFNHVSC